MEHEGPALEYLTHRLSECPGEFLAEPRATGGGTIDVTAIVCDQMRAFGGDPLQLDLQRLGVSGGPAGRNRLRLIGVAAWLMHDEWFLARPELGRSVWELLSRGLDVLAEAVPAESVVSDPDRREELVRYCLKQLNLRPQGESAAQAADLLTALDSVERVKVLQKIRAAEARANEVRAMMARRAAEEAAAKVSRE
jgi:hypothetical protein